MANDVGTLAITLAANAAPMMRGLDQARTQIQNFGQINVFKQGGSGGGLLGGLVGGATGAAVTSAIGAASAAVGALKNGIASATAAAAGLGAQAVQLGANYQDARTSFETLTGSAAKGTALLKQVQELAAATPFESNQLIAQAQMLMGMGLAADNVLPALKTLGEITAGMGGGTEKLQRLSLAFGQVVAKGRLMGGELLQFSEAGIGVGEFAKTAGKSVVEFNQAMEAGKIGADVMVNTFNRLTASGGRFNGLMARLSGNFNATFNNLKESVTLGMQDVGLSLIDGLQKSGAMDAAKGLVEWFRANAPGIGAALATGMERAKPLVSALVAGVKTLAGGFATLAQQSGGFSAPTQRSFKTLATAGVGAVVVALGNMADVLVKTGALAATAFNPILIKLQAASLNTAELLNGLAKVAEKSGFSGQAADLRASSKALVAADPLFSSAIASGRKLDTLAKTTNFAKQFSEDFAANMAKAAAAANDAGDALSGIGQITPPGQIAPEVAARASELRKDLGMGGPLDRFEAARRLTLQAGIQRDKDGNRQLGLEGVRFGLVDAFRDLERALGDTSAKFANAAERNSVESQRAINAALIQSDKNNPVLRVAEALKKAEQLQKQQVDATKRVGDILLGTRVTGRAF